MIRFIAIICAKLNYVFQLAGGAPAQGVEPETVARYFPVRDRTMGKQRLGDPVSRATSAIAVAKPPLRPDTSQGVGLRVGGRRHRGSLSGAAGRVQGTDCIRAAEPAAATAGNGEGQLSHAPASQEGSPVAARLRSKTTAPRRNAWRIWRALWCPPPLRPKRAAQTASQPALRRTPPRLQQIKRKRNTSNEKRSHKCLVRITKQPS